MHVTITTEDGLGGVFSLEVSLELTVHDLKAILEIEAAANLGEMILLHHMEPMSDGGRSLGSYGVQDNDIIVLANSSSIQPASSDNPGGSASSGGSQSDFSGTTSPPTQAPQASLPNIDWGAIRVPGPQTSQASLPNIDWGAIRVPGPQTSQASLPNIDWGAIRVPGPQTSQASLPNIDWGAIRVPGPQTSQASLPNIDWGAIRVPGPLTSQASLPNIDWGAIHVPGGQPATQPVPQQRRADDPEEVRRHLLSHPRELELLRQRNPELARALDSGNADVFRIALESHMKAVRDKERVLREEERQRIRILNANPLDPSIQRRIEEEIQKKNIEENMETAIEYTPESFSATIMLYVLVKVNGVPVKALVDSGAAGTIMSDTCAKHCGVMRLVDRRFAGMAIGVGTQRIIGKIHLGTIQIGKDFLTSSFKVLEEQTEDMLLGLDMLQRHQVSLQSCL